MQKMMKQIFLFLLALVASIVMFICMYSGHLASVLTASQIIYWGVGLLMMDHLYMMKRDQNRVQKINRLIRMIDVALIILFVGTAIYDLVHLSDRAVTVLNGLLFTMCALTIAHHEDVYDLSAAETLDQTKHDAEKRGLGESAVTEK